MYPHLPDRLTGYRQTATALYYLFRYRQIDIRRIPNLAANLLACRRHRQPPGLPPVLQLDINNTCNLRCPGCLTGLGLYEKQRHLMSWPRFTALIDSARDSTLMAALYNSGEPFLHPDIFDMIQYLTDRKIASMISTNGHFLADPASAERLVASGLSTLIISLSGTTPASYEKYHRGGDFSTVMESARQIIQARKKTGQRTPAVILRFLLLDHNRSEIEAMKRLTRQLACDAWEFRTVNWRPRLVAPRISPPDETGKKGTALKETGRVCRWPWLFAVINWHGDVFPCCFYNLGMPVMGNAFDKGGLREVWYNDAYDSFRKTMLRGKGHLPVCDQCPAETGFQGSFSRQHRTVYVKTG
ncbi:MAG: radical SAM/SPASM domain-containing protein [Desulfosudaceae bacterium]